MNIIEQSRAWLLSSLILTAGSVLAAGQPPLDAFPEAQAGQQRYVIELSPRDQEQNYKVELVIGKEMETDGVNNVSLMGSIEPRSLSGWGYTYYEVTGSLMLMSTLMGVAPDQPTVRRFVQTSGLSVRYNSRLPVVVYAPQGYELRYRIWNVPNSYQSAPHG